MTGRDIEAVGLWTPRRDGERALFSTLLGAPPRYQVVLGGVQYVIPDGTDPYWEIFRDDMGWSLLPKGEHPVWRGAPPWPHGPERERQPGWEIPRRTTWPRPRRIAPRQQLAHWRTLGDLRCALRTARTQPHALRAPRARVDVGATLLGELQVLARLSDEMEHRLARSSALVEQVGAEQQERVRSESERLMRGLQRYTAALDALAVTVNSDFAHARRRFLGALLTRADVPVYTRGGGDVPGARLFVHAAATIVRTPVAHHLIGERDAGEFMPVVAGLGELDANVLAMVEALEHDHRFSAHDLLSGKRAERAAKAYWRAAIASYGMPAKSEEYVAEVDHAPVFDSDDQPRTPRVRAT